MERSKELAESQRQYYLSHHKARREYMDNYKNKVQRSHFFENFITPLVIQRDKKCLQCGSTENLIVHHKHYNLEKLTYYDLETLCRKCHKKEHKEVKKCQEQN